jgi:hypothetical protein
MDATPDRDAQEWEAAQVRLLAAIRAVERARELYEEALRERSAAEAHWRHRFNARPRP